MKPIKYKNREEALAAFQQALKKKKEWIEDAQREFEEKQEVQTVV